MVRVRAANNENGMWGLGWESRVRMALKNDGNYMKGILVR